MTISRSIDDNFVSIFIQLDTRAQSQALSVCKNWHDKGYDVLLRIQNARISQWHGIILLTQRTLCLISKKDLTTPALEGPWDASQSGHGGLIETFPEAVPQRSRIQHYTFENLNELMSICSQHVLSILRLCPLDQLSMCFDRMSKQQAIFDCYEQSLMDFETMRRAASCRNTMLLGKHWESLCRHGDISSALTAENMFGLQYGYLNKRVSILQSRFTMLKDAHSLINFANQLITGCRNVPKFDDYLIRIYARLLQLQEEDKLIAFAQKSGTHYHACSILVEHEQLATKKDKRDLEMFTHLYLQITSENERECIREKISFMGRQQCLRPLLRDFYNFTRQHESTINTNPQK